jgi:deazaflavin-dependent oxidoreductase (nitroreductase family)
MSHAQVLQQHELLNTDPNQTWVKPLSKAPIFLWRLGLQPLVGRFLVLITHWGRKSGLPRRTVTEYHVLDGKIYVPSGWGKQSQWVQNIMADPHVTLQTARGTEHALAHRATEDHELWAIYHDMKSSYDPGLFAYCLKSLGIDDTPEDFVAKKARVYFMIFDPSDEPTPPPLEADLSGLWLIVAPFITLWLLRRARTASRWHA